MEISEEGAKIEYDCAHGTIDEPIRLDGEGRFEVRGNHVKEGAGPVHPEDLKGQPASYTGRVIDNTMTLTVRLVGSDQTIGTFTLVRDRLPRIRKCG